MHRKSGQPPNRARRLAAPTSPHKAAAEAAMKGGRQQRRLSSYDIAPGAPVQPRWGIETNKVVKVLGNAAIGLVFGFALAKGRLVDPAVISGQFLLRDFRMLQAFLTAAGTTMLLTGIAHLMPPPRPDSVIPGPMERLATARDRNLSGTPRGLAAVSAGAATLGAGMAVAGACPGVLFPQFGAGLPGAPWAVMGAVAGVATHAAFEPRIRAALDGVWRPRSARAEDYFGVSYSALAVPFGLALLSAATAAARFLPTSRLAAAHPPAFSLLASPEWHPMLAGLALGLLQVPSAFLLHAPLGASSAAVALCAPLALPMRALGVLAAGTELDKWSQHWGDALPKALFAAAAALGGWAGASSGGVWGLGSVPAGMPVDWRVQAALGGWMLLLGARTAGGCTSGHGISGFAFLGITSITAVVSMFTGGIVAAHAFSLL